MAISSKLRNIHPSGGLFTENILLRLRENPSQLEIGKLETFVREDEKKVKTRILKEREEIFDWCQQKWDENSIIIDDWDLEEIALKWLIPFFNKFGHKIEEFELNEENIDDDTIIKSFRLSYQSKGHKDPFFHFVEANEDFDSRIDYNPKRKSHHNICQQFVNLNSEINWLFLSNGKFLRIITKYYHTYSNGFLEFDLENIFANRDVKEFNVMYSIIHSSRFLPELKENKKLIDKFHEVSISEGVKIGDSLRDNVHSALELLGNELIQQSIEFQNKIQERKIDLNEFYAELLRIIYRIIFILYAEQRDMLPGAGTIYFEELSLSSLRILGERPIKNDNNHDLWNKLFLTFKLVREGDDFLDVNSYSGSLFKDDNLSLILSNDLKVSNDISLKFIRLLTTAKIYNVRIRINFLEVEEEEIGAIYESLLDFKPFFDDNFQFQLIRGTERKSTGSYYTPKSLIDILIRTTLQPLVEERLRNAGEEKRAREKVILKLKICDPACGGGTFLLAALDFLGKKLAEVRTDSESPSERSLRIARRRILQHCIYGVDKNPLAVELAKMSLWLRACVKNKPLSFLDNHIKCGNSLIGFDQKKKVKNINPNAFEAITGNKQTGIPPESKKTKNLARNQIRKEIKAGQHRTKLLMTFLSDEKQLEGISSDFQELIERPEDNPEDILIKEKYYNELVKKIEYQQAINEANIWTSAFFWPFESNKIEDIPNHPLIQEIRENIRDKKKISLMAKIYELVKDNQFFHWYIEFPEVFSSRRKGFDCVLTNPPWETLDFKENEFFGALNKEILDAPNQSIRRKAIHRLRTSNQKLHDTYCKAWRNLHKTAHFIKESGFFDLSAKGTLNTYALFTERCWRLISSTGYVGVICPTGIIMNYYMQDLFKSFVTSNSILSVFEFSNRKKIFDIDSHFRFCLLSLGGRGGGRHIIPMTFYTLRPEDVQEPLAIIFEDKDGLKDRLHQLSDDHILIPMVKEDFKLFNPNTLTCPSFRNKKDYKLLKHLYLQTMVFISKNSQSGEIIANPWSIEFKSLLHMSGDSKLFYTKADLEKLNAKSLHLKSVGKIWIDKNEKKYMPLYTGKMIWNFDHRYQSEIIDIERKKRSLKPVKNSLNNHKDKHFSVNTAYWVEENILNEIIPNYYDKRFFIGFRDLVSTDNRRTFISTIIPKTPAGHTLPIIISKRKSAEICCLIANLNSIILDYIVRTKISGTHMSFYILEQLPIFRPNRYTKSVIENVLPRVINLVFTSWDLKGFSDDLKIKNGPYEWDEDERARIRAELDAIYAHLYKINKNDLNYILETFDILKRKEIAKFKEYRTKRLVIEAYDKFAEQRELFE